MTTDQVRTLLRKRINGNLREWARENDVSPGYVSDVLFGRREPGEKVLSALGLERVVTYRKKGRAK